MTAARNSTSQSSAGRPARPLLIGATLLAVTIVLAAREETTAAAEKPQETTRPRQILLDARVVTMKPRYRSMLGTWQKVTLADDDSAVSPAAHTSHSKSSKPVEAQVLYAPDPESTESLLSRMKNLENERRLHIQVDQAIILCDDGEALLRTIRDEWFLVPATQPDDDYRIVCGSGFPVGPAISMAAHIRDGNDIAIETAFEVSNRSVTQHAKGPSSEVLTQRTEAHAITLKNTGTMAWAGLVQCDPRAERHSGLGRLPLVGGLFRSHQAAKRTKETVIFVTAYLIPESNPSEMAVRQ